MFNVFIITTCLITASIMLRGWVLTVLWSWFFVPYGLPEITIPTAIGAVIVIGMLTQHLNHNSEKKENDGDLGMVVARAFIGPLVSLAVAAIVVSFA